jgi:tetratricopeptide (TPR) repeat protein
MGAVGEAFGMAAILLVCLLIASYPAIRLFGFWVEGMISLGELIFYGSVIVVLIGGIIYTWGQPAGWLLSLAFIGLCAAVPLLNTMSEKRLRRQLLAEDIAACQRILSFDPKNKDAHFRLGQAFEALKQLDEAINEYQQILAVAPRDVSAQRRINAIIEARRRAAVNSRFCPRCDAENPPDAIYCRYCQTPLAAGHAWLDVVRSEVGRDIAKWVAVGSAVLIIGLAAVAHARVAVLAIPVLLLVGASVFYLYLSLRLE